MVVENLNSLVDSIRSEPYLVKEGDPYLCSVRTGKRDVIIPAGETKKVACRVNIGFVNKDTPVIFENDITGSLPNGIEIEESLLYLKHGNCVKVHLFVTNANLHDAVLKNRTIIGTLQLVQSVTPADVKWKDPGKNQEQVSKNSQVAKPPEESDESAAYQEGIVQDVVDEQRETIHQMLISERSAFCQDDMDIGCANDLQMNIALTDDTPVAKNYVGVPRPLIGELKEYVEDLLNRPFYPEVKISIPVCGRKEKGRKHETVYRLQTTE